MDWMTVLPNIVGILETGILIVGLYFMTCILREKKHTPAHKALQKKAGLCLFAYLILHVLRNYMF